MSFTITKNNFHDLNCFFTKNGLQNISRPNISYLKINSATNIQPVFHIGFKENMGFIYSVKINGGIIIFEVLEGYPLQDLLFSYNKNISNIKNYKFRLEDLDPMDFYCIQSENKDIFGDFILKKLKFISSKMDQSVENFGRRIIAEFICTEMLPFKIPYFYNNFISDNYNYHIIRDKKEIENIKKDIIDIAERITQNMIEKCLEMTAYEAQYRIPWIVFDRDQVPNFDQIIKDAEKAGINVGWSNPCFEIWMFAYFGNMPAIQESWICCSRFGELYKVKTGQDYSKADSDMYKRLCENGDEDKALQIAAQKYEQCLREGKMVPSHMCPATTVHELVGEIRRKVKG